MRDEDWERKRSRWIIFALTLFVIGQLCSAAGAFIGAVWGSQ